MHRLETIDLRSGRIAVVVAQQSAEKSLALNSASFRHFIGRKQFGRPRPRSRKRQISESLMRAMFIVKPDVTSGDVIEVAQTEAEEVIQCLPFCSAYPRFHE